MLFAFSKKNFFGLIIVHFEFEVKLPIFLLCEYSES